MLALAPDGIPRLTDAGLNLPVALAALAATMVAVVVCGAGPMRLARSRHLIAALQDSSRATAAARPMRWRAALLMLQVALAVVLLVTAGLVTRSFQALRGLDLGFQSSQVLSLQIDPRLPPTRVNAWMHQLIAVLAARPDTEAIGAVYLRPLALGPIGQGTTVVLEGQPETPETAAANPLLNYQVATPGYFAAMRIPLRAGRLFTDDDRDGGERVAIVGESTARRLWPGREAVGQRLLTSSFDRRDGAPATAWRRVVGVVADVRYRGLDEVSLDLYDPATQSTLPATDLVIRTSADPLALASIVRDEARRLAPGVIVDGVTTLDADRRPGLGAVALRRVGVHALRHRRHRAHRGGTLQRRGARRGRAPARVRAAAGPRRHGTGGRARRARHGGAPCRRWVSSPACSRPSAASSAVRGLLFGIPALDLPTYAGVIAVIAVVVFVATYVPMRRAMRVAPAEVLRGV